MNTNRDPVALELAESCQRLVRQARHVLFNAPPAGDGRTAEALRLVNEVIRLLEHGALGAGVRRRDGPELLGTLFKSGAAGGPGPGGIARRMLGAGELAVEAPRDPSAQGAPPSPKHEIGLHGREKICAMPDLIGFLSSQQKTGLLEIVTGDETFQLEFEAGDVVHAQSDRTPEGQRIGDVLVARNAIAREALERVRGMTPGPRLGATLVESGLVTREHLLGALETQIQQLFQRLFEARVECFRFWIGPPIHADARIRLNATSLLLEGARVSDEKHWQSNPH